MRLLSSIKVAVVVVGFGVFLNCVTASPVSQDVSEGASTLPSLPLNDEPSATTLNPALNALERRQGALEDDEVDDDVLTDTMVVMSDDKEVEALIQNFKYPVEPEISQSDYEGIHHDEGEPLDARIMEEAGITHVVQREEDSMPYYAGRAKCQCGRPGERNHPLRIVNGTVIRINDYPWTVALIRKRWIGRPKGAYCGGTLINNVSWKYGNIMSESFHMPFHKKILIFLSVT